MGVRHGGSGLAAPHPLLSNHAAHSGIMNSENLTNILESVTPFNMRLVGRLGTLLFPFLAGEEFFQIRAMAHRDVVSKLAQNP